jgi:hypothetical protein
VVVHLRRCRDRDCTRLSEEPQLIDGRWSDILKAVLIVFSQPVGDQLVDRCGLDDGPGEDMCSNLARLLEQ